MASMLADGVFQIGFVVPDIHGGMPFFKDKLGVPEFLFIEKPELQDETYLGRPTSRPKPAGSIRLAYRRSSRTRDGRMWGLKRKT
jgi:hypothetical protein